MASQWILTMTADVSAQATTGFFNAYSNSAPVSRLWQESTGGTTTNKGNADSYVPKLSYSRGTSTDRDSFQLVVNVAGLTNTQTVSAVILYVTFGRQQRSNAGNSVASPFTNANGSPIVILNQIFTPTSPTTQFSMDSITTQLSSAVTSNPTLRFEYSVVASVTVADGSSSSVYEFGYDPEMDVDVRN